MESNNNSYLIPKEKIVALVVILFYLLGLLFPDLFWSTHNLAFFPFVISLGILIFSVIILFRKSIIEVSFDLSSNITIGVITLTAGVIMYNFPILHDQYGDSYKFTDFLEKVAQVIPELAKEKLFSFGIGPSDGQDSILALVTYISFYFNITYASAFLWLGVFCGSAFVLSWQLFIRYIFNDKKIQLIMLLVGVTAPFLLNFFGHIEIYAPILLVYFVWMMLLVVYYQIRSVKIIWLLVILWIVCLKLHSVAVLYFPALIFTILFHYLNSNRALKKTLTLRGLIVFVVLPVMMIGLIVYFFILQDHVDERTLTVYVEGIDRLFLPLFSPDAPLDNYNLFSVNHIFDFLVLPFLWSPVCIFLITFFIVKKVKVNWNDPLLLLVGLTLLFNCMLFFATNPLLSMPFDWDLFCLPAIPFLIFTTLLMMRLELQAFNFSKLMQSVYSITVITIPFFIIHSSAPMLSKRYEALGIRVYDSYYEWTFKRINYALEMSSADLKEKYANRGRIIELLRPKAMKEIDPEFAQFLTQQGRYHLRYSKDFESALDYLYESDLYDPDDSSNNLLILESLFSLERYEEALIKAITLVDVEYPTKQKSLSVVIHCALKSKDYNIAKKYSTIYITQWENEVIDEVHKRLVEGAELERLHLLFD